MGFIASSISTVISAIVSASGVLTVTSVVNHQFKVGDRISGLLELSDGTRIDITGAEVTSVISSTEFTFAYVGLTDGSYTPISTSYLARDEYYRDNYQSVDLIELHLKNSSGVSTPLYLCGGGFNITYDSPTAPNAGSNTYEAQGEFISFSKYSEDFEIKVGKFTVQLSGVGNDYVNRFTAYSPEGNRVVIYRAFLEYTVTDGVESLGIVPQPLMIFDGIIYNVAITETGSSCQVSVECGSLFSDFERTAGRKSNNGSNWAFQDGNTYDTSMEQAGFVGQSNFLWGRI